jgi:hypothetical protein
MGLLYGRAGRLTAENGGFRRGQSKLVFEIFRCRAVGGGLQLLEADYAIVCWRGAHLAWAVVGGVCMLVCRSPKNPH